MANCLLGYIGLKGCGPATPASGRWLNSVPGVSTELIDNIASADQVSFANVWKDIQDMAWLRLKNDVVGALAQKVNFRRSWFETKRPKFDDNRTALPAASEYRGIFIEIPESRYSQLFIDSIYVYSRIDQEGVPVRVIDLYTEEVVYSQMVDLKAKMNTISLNQAIPLSFESQRLLIAIDATSVDGLYFSAPEGGYYNEGFIGECPDSYSSSAFQIRPASYALDFASHTYSNKPLGVWAKLRIGCSEEAFICENLDVFQSAILYLEAWQLMFFKLASRRVNFFTYYDEEKSTRVMNEFATQYETALKNALLGIPTDEDGMCFSCQDQNVYSQSGQMP